MMNDPTYEALLKRVQELETRDLSSHHTDAALADSEDRYRRLSENLPVTVYSALPDRDSGSFFISGRMQKLTGYPAQAFTEDSGLFHRIIHPEDREVVNREVRLALNDKSVFDIEYRIISSGGEIKWVRDRAIPIFSEGRLVRVEGVMEDITSSRMAHEALKMASKQWQNTFDAMREALLILDNNFRILECNAAMRNMLNKPADEIIGRRCWELVHGTDYPLAECPCPRVMKSRKRECMILDINGRCFEVAVDPQFDDQGKISAFIHIMSDITEHKRAENASREAHQTLLTVLDSIDAAIYVADMQSFQILFMNRHMKEAFEGDLTGQTCFKAFHDSAASCETCTGDQLVSGDSASKGSCIWEGHNPNTGRWYINHDRAIKWPDGRYVLLRVATDISEIKSMEKERLHTEARLRQAQKMEAIGTLAGGIAHDFNNILSAILGYSELALDDALNNRVSVNFIRQILKAGYRARELVQQILTFSRQTETEAKPIQVKPIVKEALKLLRASLPSTIEIKTAISSEAIVEADPTQIHQVIMNLCTNAGHAMRQQGGELRVEIAEEILTPEFTNHYPHMQPGLYLKLEVGDTGHGIPPSLVDKIFDPYFTTKEKGEGTGMGLAVVQGIVQSCGGAVAVASKENFGTVFKVYLPVIQQEAVYHPEVDKIIPGGHERILFVDDEPPLADLGKQLLERYGYTVTICTSSMEALSLFENRPLDFDLVITDMTMPHMTGDIMAQKMMDMRPQIPVVICTGYSEKITQELIERLGIRGFVMKPLVRNELALSVRQALDGIE